MKYGYLPLLLACSLPCSAEDTSPTTVMLDDVKPAEAIERKPPRYPDNEGRKGQEGWVQLSYVISDEGKVLDPVIEDSSGVKGFNRAALRAINEWTFEPASRNGEPVQQCQNRVMLYFKLDRGTQGVRRNFRRRYMKLAEALETNVDEAETLLTELKALDSWNLYEDARLWTMDALVAKNTGDKERELQSISRALYAAETPAYIGEDTYRYLLVRQFTLQLDINRYADALDTFAAIEDVGMPEPEMSGIRTAVAQINDLLASERPVVSHKNIGSQGALSHRLLRSQFSVNKIDGQLSSLDIRCDNHRVKYTVTEDAVWQIPDSWGQCFVRFEGHQGSAFDVVELAAN